MSVGRRVDIRARRETHAEQLRYPGARDNRQFNAGGRQVARKVDDCDLVRLGGGSVEMEVGTPQNAKSL